MRAAILVFLLAGAAGCSTTSGGSNSAPPTKLAVASYHLWGARPAGTPPVRYTVTCDPAAGSAQNPARICAALRDYIRRGAPAATCPGMVTPRGGMPWFTVKGTYRGKPFRLSRDATAWCGISSQAQRDLWIISAFPRAFTNVIVMNTYYNEKSPDGRPAS